jgi:hypothetical protein
VSIGGDGKEYVDNIFAIVKNVVLTFFAFIRNADSGFEKIKRQ